MNKSNFIFEATPNSKILEAVDLVNRTADTSQGVNKSRLLLTTLSTTVMMAFNKPLSKEYYQWTRAYLETIKNEDGTSLPNISKFLKFIDWYEKQNNIDDIMQKTQMELSPEEQIEIRVQEAEDDALPMLGMSALSSTKLPGSSQGPPNFSQNENSENAQQNDGDEIDANPEQLNADAQ